MQFINNYYKIAYFFIHGAFNMNKTITLAGLLFISPIISSTISAEGWEGEGEFGATFSSGNTENNNPLAKLKLINKQGAWKNEVGLTAINNKDTDTTTSERYQLTGKTSRDFSENYYTFASGRYEKDRFSGYKYQASLAGGLGMHAIKKEKVTLDIEGGLGYSLNETDAGIENNEPVLRGGLFYKNQLTDTTHFLQNFTVESGSDNTYMESETGVTVKMTDKVGLKASLLVKNNSDVPAGTEKTDSITAISMTYGF